MLVIDLLTMSSYPKDLQTRLELQTLRRTLYIVNKVTEHAAQGFLIETGRTSSAIDREGAMEKAVIGGEANVQKLFCVSLSP